eukprot:179350_1
MYKHHYQCIGYFGWNVSCQRLCTLARNHCFGSQRAERNSQIMYMNSYDGLLTIADCLFDGNQRYEGLIYIQDGNLWNNKQFECVGDYVLHVIGNHTQLDENTLFENNTCGVHCVSYTNSSWDIDNDMKLEERFRSQFY